MAFLRPLCCIHLAPFPEDTGQVREISASMRLKNQPMTLAYFVDEIRTPFVINDIKQIAKKADTIYLFSVETLEGKEALPDNVVVFESFIKWQNFKPLRIVLKNIWSILGIYLSECVALKKLLPFKKSIALLASNIFKAESVMEKFTVYGLQFTGGKSMGDKNTQHSTLNIQHFPFYSFWFYDCIYLAWMRKKGWIKKGVTRAHGGDLFEERVSLEGNILFRNFQFKNLDYVISISNAGRKYLKNKYPKFASKIKTLYLGSKDEGMPSNNHSDSSSFVLVSCARVRWNKRIHKIAEMLNFIDAPITWIHIGDENLNAKKDWSIPEYLKNKNILKSKENVEVISTGLLDYPQIIELYRTKRIDLFISLSEEEGIPVSMMEAISFGIPILSTDVGGCKEIVTEQTGILIPLETSMEKVAEIITDFRNTPQNTPEFRLGVRKFWEENFDADKNYKALFDLIIEE